MLWAQLLPIELGRDRRCLCDFRASFLSDLKPHPALEQTLADRLIMAAWRLKRFQRMEGAFYSNRVDDFLKEHPEANPSVLEVDFASQAEPRPLKAQSATASQSRYDGCSSANLALVP